MGWIFSLANLFSLLFAGLFTGVYFLFKKIITENIVWYILIGAKAPDEWIIFLVLFILYRFGLVGLFRKGVAGASKWSEKLTGVEIFGGFFGLLAILQIAPFFPRIPEILGFAYLDFSRGIFNQSFPQALVAYFRIALHLVFAVIGIGYGDEIEDWYYNFRRKNWTRLPDWLLPVWLKKMLLKRKKWHWVVLVPALRLVVLPPIPILSSEENEMARLIEVHIRDAKPEHQKKLSTWLETYKAVLLQKAREEKAKAEGQTPTLKVPGIDNYIESIKDQIMEDVARSMDRAREIKMISRFKKIIKAQKDEQVSLQQVIESCANALGTKHDIEAKAKALGEGG